MSEATLCHPRSLLQMSMEKAGLLGEKRLDEIKTFAIKVQLCSSVTDFSWTVLYSRGRR